jgi:DNA-3-methyladenine glycosylase I
MAAEMGIGVGPDGRDRCWWCLGSEEYLDYHDNEWGRPLHDERALFELLSLEAFQSGLSWLTILRKRPGFRRAFDGFDFERVAEYGERDVDRLLADASIVRNRAKIEGTVRNARAVVGLRSEGETLDGVLWSFAPDDSDRPPPSSGDEIESATAESAALAKELQRRGFALLGPTTVYSTMQAAGLVNDHLAGCAFRRP